MFVLCFLTFMSLSWHECVQWGYDSREIEMADGKSISQIVASLNTFVHDMINWLYIVLDIIPTSTWRIYLDPFTNFDHSMNFHLTSKQSASIILPKKTNLTLFPCWENHTYSLFGC